MKRRDLFKLVLGISITPKLINIQTQKKSFTPPRLFVENGQLKWESISGTVTTIAPA